MTIVKTEFSLALNQVATERGISPDEVIASIETAILAAYKKEYPDKFSENLIAKVSKDNGESKILEDARDVTPPGFGRIAAQTAKQVIIQKIREAEKKNVITHYKTQIGAVIRGRIIRYDGRNAYLDIGKTEGLLPKEGQLRNERYEVNQTMVVLVQSISEDKFGNTHIMVSRSDPKLVEELFKREVPEVANNTVEIKKIVRSPGERAKIAVFSSQGGVDPVGACVGQKGVRVQTVTDELGGYEKLDIIQWNSDPKLFIAAALSPAKIDKIEIDVANKRAKVFVDEKQAPLAIGKGGINVGLASRLTDHILDIVQIVPAPIAEEPKAEMPTNPAPPTIADTSKNTQEK